MRLITIDKKTAAFRTVAATRRVISGPACFPKLLATHIRSAAAVFAAAGSAFAQQTEFVAPDAGFKSTLTRAEVRQDLAQAQSRGLTAQRQHDGQDAVYVRSDKARQEVKIEQAKAAKQQRSQSPVNSLYFG
jgi:hypothetical protein